MRCLELLSPARNLEIGIAAIDCGADAVYIAGPDFGARKDAGNSFEDIASLCNYAHRFGARVFVTYNIAVREDELEELHSQMLKAQEAGADAFIVRDERIFEMKDITVPLHASTQCAIRDIDRAKHFEALGSARIVLERELSLDTVRKICNGVNCEVEFFETHRCTELFFLYYFRYTSRPYDEQEPLLKDLNQCIVYRKTIEFFIKTKGLHGYFERNGGSLEKAIANAKRSMDEKLKDGRDYTYSELGRLMEELKELE